MDSPVSVVKENLSPNRIMRGLIALLVLFAILDLVATFTGVPVLDWLTRPISTARAYYAQAKAKAA